MVARRLGAALAISAMLIPTAGYAAEVQIGTIGAGSDALVLRDGKVVQAAPGTALYAGDRVVTRANGSARVTMANNCTVSVGASAMLPMSASSCAKPATISFDQGRVGYAGSSSAFQGHGNGGFWLAGGAFLAGLAAALYIILHHRQGHHCNDNGFFCPPVSP